MKNIVILSLLLICSFGGFSQQYVPNNQFLSSDQMNVSSQLSVELDSRNFINYSVLNEADFKKRKPGVAFLWSFLVPGGGQFYNGQSYKGGLMLGGAVFGLLLLLDGSEGSNTEASYTAGSLLLVGTSLWSLIDAPISAVTLNKENGVTLNIESSFQEQSNLLTNRNSLSFGPKLTLTF